MNHMVLYITAGVILFVIGLLGLIVQANLVRKILSVNIMGSGVFLALVAPAERMAGAEPDPVPHAMVLTGIVVAVSATAFALMLARRLFEETGKAELPEEEDIDAQK